MKNPKGNKTALRRHREQVKKLYKLEVKLIYQSKNLGAKELLKAKAKRAYLKNQIELLIQRKPLTSNF